jgi:antitoxin (DNA-binding transcriptional repressor) of toxin-antitoxin stability system
MPGGGATQFVVCCARSASGQHADRKVQQTNAGLAPERFVLKLQLRLIPIWQQFGVAKMSMLYDHYSMTKSVAQAKAQFCEIVTLAGKGKRTTITRHDKPVACVVPAENDPRRLTEQWRRRVAGVRLNRKGQHKLTVSQLIQEGRK